MSTISQTELVALVLTLAAGALGIVASAHALLHKRSPRSAFGWIAVCLTFPLVGAGLYYVFGINRTQRRARQLRDGEAQHSMADHPEAPPPLQLRSLETVGRSLTGQGLVGGNQVQVLHCGEVAYPAMLEAIDGARQRVLLSSYIFDSDDTGKAFAAALGRARDRGVAVCVLLDGFGEWYSLPRSRHLLRRAGADVQRFLPPRLLPPSFAINLRNHRKILVVDDALAFTGGMNVSDRHVVAGSERRSRVVDVHFALRGPLAADLAELFRTDWEFAGGRTLPAACRQPPEGNSPCRVIADGPDEALGRLLLLLIGAVAEARQRVTIMTPYFLPPRELLGALQAAALRGVDVCVLLPRNNNLFFMHRATRHLLWELLERGVRIYYQDGPFVHSKLLLVDDGYAQVGSANVDARSLRLNFELMVEIFDAAVVAELHRHADAAREAAHEVTLAEVDARRLPTRLFDGLAWLFSPYL